MAATVSAVQPDLERRAAARSAAAKQALVLGHARLVRGIAFRLLRTMPGNVEVNDLIQAGMLGLMEAAERYVGGPHASFATFARHRIRGAILDSTRKADWSPRSLRRRLREIEAARRQIERETCAPAKPAAIALALGIPLEAYHRTLRDADLTRLSSLDEIHATQHGRPSFEPADDEPGPEASLEKAQTLGAAQASIDALPEFERAILMLYYGDDLALREIGDILALSESRVCQIRKGIIGRLQIAARNGADG